MGFIRYAGVKTKGKVFGLFQMAAILTGISAMVLARPVSAAKIVAEEETVVLDASQLSEPDKNRNAAGQSPPQKDSAGQGGQMPCETTPDGVQGEEKTGGVKKKSVKRETRENEKEMKKSTGKQPSGELTTASGNAVANISGEVSQNQLTEYDKGGVFQPVVSENQAVSQNSGNHQNQVTIQKQIKEETSITIQNHSENQSKEQEKNQVKQAGTKNQWKAEGEKSALLLGFCGIYSTIFLAGFMFLRGKGGKKYMKSLQKKITAFGIFLFCLSLGMTTQAAGENDSSGYIAEEKTNVTAVSENNAGIQDLFTLDWKTASDKELDHILGMTDFEKTGYWLKSLSREELQELLARDTVLPKEMWVATYKVGEDGTLEETEEKDSVIYYQYCMGLVTGLQKAQTFQHSSGYYDYKFTMGSACSHYRMKISGLDTSKDTSKQQTATLAVIAVQQTNGNFANFSSKAGDYNHSEGYNIKKLSNNLDGTGNYYILDAGFTFTKPEGYTVSLTKENAHSGVCNIYYYENGAYKTNQNKFTSDMNGGSSVFESLLAHTNLYTNTTVGGSGQNAPDNPVCYHFQFTPITYTIRYRGNFATSGSVQDQICAYGNSYYVQQNGFTRQYHIIYNGNGGSADKSSDIAKYSFQGWGWENDNSVTHIPGQSYSNAKNVQNAMGIFYAIWKPGSITLPSATRTGYTFAGWSKLSNAASGMAAKTTFTPVADETFYATWKPNNYQIVFKDGMTEETKGTQNMTYDQKAGLMTLESLGITRPGYTFQGWKSSVGNYTDGEKVCNLSGEANGVVTMTAEWKAKNDTPYRVIHRTQKNLTSYEYIDREIEQFVGTTDTAVTPDTKEFEGYLTPEKQTVTIAGDGSTQVVYNYKIVLVDRILTYRVEHYLQDRTDRTKYHLDTEKSHNYTGEDGQVVTPDVVTTYEGYVLPSPQTVTLQRGNANVIKYYYQLSNEGNTTNVTNITNKNVEIYNEGDTIEEGDINNFKPGETKYYTDGAGNQYEILVNQDGTLTICSVKSAEANSKNLKLAGTITINQTKYQVTEIAPYAFKNNKNIKNLTIGNGITTIGKGAFEGCTGLVSVKFGVGLSVIGDRAFCQCTSLQKVRTTRTLTQIGAKAFYNCKKLDSYSVGKYVKSIGSYAFYNCKKLKRITLAESMELVGKNAFYKCNSLKQVSIKSTKLIKVGNGAFKKCSKSLRFTVPAKKKKAYAKLLKGKS